MLESEAMRLAAERSCEMRWDDDQRCWVILAVSYDADMVCLPAATLARLDADEFLREWIPERP
ncbi:hypothetical protein [Sinimarinibacterium flocculans]|uniref:Uncharacterized protein n=1 Tax=Sinimarinibacterium flocculans TaxID=985250 RepID=A0A318ED38_9GAMM|nr:hypothetical protein [Sinimarinibacterium flocculans]MEC9361617.1 hypothetical protein [Pseudomonadota bacterium]PXV70413.1 hypothetical protein C8D93_102265 [Sinimarinibacterium flocculans]